MRSLGSPSWRLWRTSRSSTPTPCGTNGTGWTRSLRSCRRVRTARKPSVEPDASSARGVRGRGAGPPRGTRRRAARIPGGWWAPGWVRDPVTRRRNRGRWVCRGRSGWPIGARAIRTPRRSGGRRMCWDDAAPVRSPRTGTATRTAAGKSRSANRLSRSGCGGFCRGVGVLAPGGGVFVAGLAGTGCLRRSESGIAELLCGPPSG